MSTQIASVNASAPASITEILLAVQTGKITAEDAGTLIASLRPAKASGATVKVSDKGCFTIGIGGRWPVCLYPNQVVKLLANLPGILEAMATLPGAGFDKGDQSESEFRAYVQSFSKRLAK